MTSTRRRSRKEFLQKTPSDGLEELRLAFHARLQSDRVHFATLSAALARAEESPGWIFQDLQFRAHKIRGGAAIFEIAAVEAAGYTGATTEISGYAEKDKPYELARFEILGDSGVEGLAEDLKNGEGATAEIGA